MTMTKRIGGEGGGGGADPEMDDINRNGEECRPGRKRVMTETRKELSRK